MSLILTLVGPTAVGKTALSIRLAQRHEGVVLIADPRQMYQGMNIGTAKPTLEEQAQVPHLLIDQYAPDQKTSAGIFARQVEELLPLLFARYKLVIIVGGATLYMDALWFELDEIPEVPLHIRQSVQQAYELRGLTPLLGELAEVDPETYARIDRQNPARVIRALEVYRASGQPISAFQQGRKVKTYPYPIFKMGLRDDRARLYERINRRVALMVEAGLEQEVRDLLAQGYTPDLQAMQSIGYQEWMPYFEGKYDKAEVIRLIQRNSRRYAKRQLTYWRRYTDILWAEAGETENLEAEVMRRIIDSQ